MIYRRLLSGKVLLYERHNGIKYYTGSLSGLAVSGNAGGRGRAFLKAVLILPGFLSFFDGWRTRDPDPMSYE